MIRFWGIGIAIFLTACSTNQPNKLTISQANASDLSSIHVSFKFYGDDDGTTELIFPTQWGPEENLGALVSNIKVEGGLGNRDSDAMHKLSINHPANANLTVSFDINQDYFGEPSWSKQRVPGMRPVLQSDYATFIGHTVFPDFVEKRKRKFAVSFRKFGSGTKPVFSHVVGSDGHSKPIRMHEIKNSIYTFGNFRYSENRYNGLNVRASIRGNWSLSDTEISKITSTVLLEAANLFQDPAFKQYFVALSSMPSLPESSTVIGTGLTESFFILATRNADARNLEHTIVHEILHEWITRRMGKTDEQSDPKRMWFIEGMTEYYTQLILLRSGRISLDEFLDGMNELWRNYQISSVNSLPVEQLLARIWDSRETERLPYQRGALLSFHWDTVSRKQGELELADALIGLIDDAKKKRDQGVHQTLTDEKISDALGRVVGPQFHADYIRFLKGGKRLNSGDLTVPSCLIATKDGNGISRWILSHNANPQKCRESISGNRRSD